MCHPPKRDIYGRSRKADLDYAELSPFLLHVVAQERDAEERAAEVNEQRREAEEICERIDNLYHTLMNCKANVKSYFNRARQLADNMATYEKIMNRIELRDETEFLVRDTKNKLSDFIDGESDFEEVWGGCMLIIRNSKNRLERIVIMLQDLFTIAEENLEDRNYEQLVMVRIRAREQWREATKTDQRCNEARIVCTDYSNRLRDRITELEAATTSVVKLALARIQELQKMKISQ